MTRLATHIILSTAHLEEEVSAALTDKGPDKLQMKVTGTYLDSVIVCEFSYGHWVKVMRPTGDSEDELAEHKQRLDSLPECLKDCMTHAAQFGASWILFDCDEETIGMLPTYSWH